MMDDVCYLNRKGWKNINIQSKRKGVSQSDGNVTIGDDNRSKGRKYLAVDTYALR